MASYQWKTGFFKADPNVIGKELEDLADLNNLTPMAVLDKARDVNSPLHDLFEWDDTVAAEKYRLFQARTIIQQITIVKDHPNAEKHSVRAFVTESTNDGHYQLITKVVSDPEAYDVLLMRAKAELQAFKNKYKALTEFEELFNEIDKFL